MKCPSCGHENLTDFPFCEQCLAVLPVRPGTAGAGGAFDLGDEARPSAAAARGYWPPFPWNPPDLENPLIGREKALKALVTGWQEVVRTWTARIHLLVSGYGMGKSRVAAALVKEARKEDPDTLVVRTRCPAAGGPFRMWDALLRTAFDIPADSDPSEAGARLRRAVEARLPDDVDEVAGAVAWLVGYDLEGRPDVGAGVDEEALIGRGTAALARLLAAVAVERPLLLVVDHANRASARSLALAGALEATLKGRPVMLVLAGSPELTEFLPGWERFPVTRLERLARRDAEKMLLLFLAGLGRRPPKDLVRRVLERGHGNPYALKSIVRYLREAGAVHMERGEWVLDETVAWDLDLPDDLEGVVLARVGTLSARVRTTLGRAAVVGDEFWLGALVALQRLEAEELSAPGAIRSDDAPAEVREDLATLERMRFIERRASTLPGEEAWGFRSDVQWQVARGVLPTGAQERLHRVVGQWLLVHVGHLADDHLVDLARHAEGAGRPGEAARYLLRAARRAAQEHDLRGQQRLLDEALALVDGDDVATRMSVDFDLGDALGREGDVEAALERYQEALQLAWRVRHRGKGAAALARIGHVEQERGEFDTAYGHMLQALRLFEAVQDRKGVARVSNDMGQLFFLRGEFEKALRFHRKAEELYRELGDRRGLAESRHRIGALQHDRGDLALAEEHLADALDLRRRLDDRRGITRTLNTLGAVAYSGGEAERAVESWSEALELAGTLGDRAVQAVLTNNLGEALLALDRGEEARERLEQAIDLARATDQPRILVDASRNLARLSAAEGRWEDAEEALEAARSQAEKLGLRRLIALVDRTAGEVETSRAEAGGEREQALERAEAAFRRAAEAFETGGYDLEAALSRERLAAALEARGQGDEAGSERTAASELRARHRTRTVGAP